MKGLFTFLFCAGCWLMAPAQLRIALVAGAHQADVIEENDLPDFSQTKQGYSTRLGAHFGFIADLRLSTRSNFYFQPGVSIPRGTGPRGRRCAHRPA